MEYGVHTIQALLRTSYLLRTWYSVILCTRCVSGCLTWRAAGGFALAAGRWPNIRHLFPFSVAATQYYVSARMYSGRVSPTCLTSLRTLEVPTYSVPTK